MHASTLVTSFKPQNNYYRSWKGSPSHGSEHLTKNFFGWDIILSDSHYIGNQ